MSRVGDLVGGALEDVLAVPSAPGASDGPLTLVDVDPRWQMASEVVATRQSVRTLRAARPVVSVAACLAGFGVASWLFGR